MSRVSPSQFALAVAIAATLTSCDKASRVAAPADVAPIAASPADAVRRLEWAINHRDLDMVSGLLPDDFQFTDAVLGSAGNGVGSHWDRARFLATLSNLFHGDATGPPAAEKIQFTLDRNLVPFSDTRPGKNPIWHKAIRSSLYFRIEHASGQVLESTGYLLFEAARGDSVTIPPEWIARGVKSDASRWWISGIEDETLLPGGLAANPAHGTRFSDLLLLYWNPL